MKYHHTYIYVRKVFIYFILTLFEKHRSVEKISRKNTLTTISESLYKKIPQSHENKPYAIPVNDYNKRDSAADPDIYVCRYLLRPITIFQTYSRISSTHPLHVLRTNPACHATLSRGPSLSSPARVSALQKEKKNNRRSETYSFYQP